MRLRLLIEAEVSEDELVGLRELLANPPLASVAIIAPGAAGSVYYGTLVGAQPRDEVE